MKVHVHLLQLFVRIHSQFLSLLCLTEPPLSTINPDQPESAVFSQLLTAGLSAAAVLTLLVIMCAVIGVIYRKRGRQVSLQSNLS